MMSITLIMTIDAVKAVATNAAAFVVLTKPHVT